MKSKKYVPPLVMWLVFETIALTLWLALVHRFVNNYTNRVGCGFECAGIKTQA